MEIICIRERDGQLLVEIRLHDSIQVITVDEFRLLVVQFDAALSQFNYDQSVLQDAMHNMEKLKLSSKAELI